MTFRETFAYAAMLGTLAVATTGCPPKEPDCDADPSAEGCECEGLSGEDLTCCVDPEDDVCACEPGDDNCCDALSDGECEDATWFYVAGDFAYDSATDTIVSWTDRDEAGATVPGVNPIVVLELYPDDGGSPGEILCTLVVEQAGPIDAVTTLSGENVILGVEFDWASITLTTDCFDPWYLDPGAWDESKLATVDWGFALDGALAETASDPNSIWGAVASAVDAPTFAAEYAPNMTGGSPWFSTTGHLNAGDELYFARGRAMDNTATVQVDGNNDPIWILKGDVNDGTPPSAVYGVRTAFLLTFNTPLEDVFTVQ